MVGSIPALAIMETYWTSKHWLHQAWQTGYRSFLEEGDSPYAYCPYVGLQKNWWEMGQHDAATGYPGP